MKALIQGIKDSYKRALTVAAVLLSVALLLGGYLSLRQDAQWQQHLLAEQQKALAERIARLSLALSEETNGQAIKLTTASLESALAQMQNNHQLLTDGLAGSDSELASLYFGEEKLDEKTQNYLSTGQQVIEAKKAEDPLALAHAVDAFMSDRPSLFVERLGHVSRLYQTDSDSTRLIGLGIELLLWLGALAGLWFTSKAATGEVERSVSRTVSTLKQQNAIEVQSKEAAIALANSKDRYLTSIIAEIRAPINGVLGMVNLLKKTGNDQQKRYYTEKIENATVALSHLTKQISDFSLAESGSLVIEKKEFMVLKLIDEVAALMKPRAKNKNLQLFVRVAMDFPEKILGDEKQLRQVLFNLLANAIQFTEKGQVTLSVKAEQRTDESLVMLISVSDTGPGLTDVQRQRIFKPFEQLEAGEGQSMQGTGLGLTISAKLLELMGGEIECRSEPGSGTTFTCRLPVSIRSHSRHEHSHQEFVDRLSRLRVLVVDDEPSILDIVSSVLGKLNVFVKTCELAEEAISYVIHEYQQGHEIDIVITDWEMPGMNGEQMATKIVEYLDSSGVAPPKFILLSAFKAGDSSSYERTMFNSVIKKPFKVPELINNLLIVSEVEFDDDSAEVVPLLPLSGKRVLLIEDQQVNQVIVSQMLSGYGMLVDLASSGTEGLRKLTDNDYDILVTDIELPLMDGIELTENIRAVASWASLPVIGLSTQHELALKHKCLNAGMNAIVYKPVDAMVLLDEIVPLVQQERSQDEKGSKDDVAFDVAAALSLFDGNKQLLFEVLNRFLSRFDGLEGLMQKLYGDQDYVEIACHCHSLKGMADALALNPLSHCADTIIAGIGKGNTETLSHQLDYLLKVWAQSQQSIQQYLANTVQS